MEWYERTDIGRLRQTNQDVCAAQCDEGAKTATLVVCDGMGGANAGNIASMLAMQGFLSVMQTLPEDATREDATLDMHRALAQANETVYQMAKTDMRYDGMGTTLVAAHIVADQAVILNVGDSRAYVLHAGELAQITQDHSYVGQLVREGKLTREQARVHPQRNLITRAVGVDKTVAGDVFMLDLQVNDIVLLCSDGLFGMLTDAQICEVILSAHSLREAGDRLIEAANAAGGKDNISVVLWRQEIQTEGGA